MTQIVGLSFKYVNEIHYVTNFNVALKVDDWVIAKTVRAKELGRVDVITNSLPEGKSEDGFAKRIVRKATDRDFKRDAANRGREVSAFQIAVKKIDRLGLPMRLIKVHYLFDHSRIIFYFKAAGKVDFRQLVKDLASVFKTRIELRQIGVRDEAKMLGGIASCGRPLCCATWIREFSPVTVRMAKDQHLSLNPNKISGVCGRLQCCLAYEQKFYEGAMKGICSLGSLIKSSQGDGKLIKVNIFNNTANLLLEDASIVTIPVEELKDPARVVPRGRRSRSAEGDGGTGGNGQTKRRGRRDRSQDDDRSRSDDRRSGGREGRTRRTEEPPPPTEGDDVGTEAPSEGKAPETRSDAPVEKAPEARADATGEKAPEARVDAPVEKAPETRSDTPVEKAPETRADAPVEKAPEARADATGEKAPETRADGPVEQAPEARADAPVEKAPETRADGAAATGDGDGDEGEEGRRKRRRRRGKRRRNAPRGDGKPDGGGHGE